MAASPPQRAPVAWPGPSGRIPWSTRLIREWAALRYPGAPMTEQLRLGPTEEMAVGVVISPAYVNALRVTNWYADGVLQTPDEILVIESKMKPNPGAVGQVLFYMRLAITTPALLESLHKPLVPVVLFAERDDTVATFAKQLGCRVEVYSPPWLEEYLSKVQFRYRSPGSNSAPTAT